MVLKASPSSPNSSPVRMSTRASSWPAASGLRGALQREDRGDERRPKRKPTTIMHEQRDRDRDHQLPLQRGGVGVGLAGRLLDDDRPAERRDARGDAEVVAAVVVDVFERDRRAVLLAARDAARAADAPFMLRACATSAFLSGSPWATSSPSGATTRAIAVLADADAVDHPPHFLEAELADEPAGRLVQTLQAEREHAGRQQVVVDADRRHHRRRRSPAARPSGSSTRGLPMRLVAIVSPDSSNSVISRNSRNCRT